MPIEYILPTSIGFSLLSWSLILYWYGHPYASRYPLSRVIEVLLFLHTFRYIGLMFLIPGVTTEPLDPRFSHPAAYGDLLAAALAFIAIASIRLRLPFTGYVVALFNVVGFGDLLIAIVRGILFTADGHLGAAFWIPATIVPLLLVTHVYIFILLIKSEWQFSQQQTRTVGSG